jgi:hypothetical protein
MALMAHSFASPKGHMRVENMATGELNIADFDLCDAKPIALSAKPFFHNFGISASPPCFDCHQDEPTTRTKP